MTSCSKKKVKSNKIQTQISRKSDIFIKCHNQWIIAIDIAEEIKVKSTENIVYKIIEENFPRFNNEVPINIKEVHRTPNILDQRNRNGKDKVKKISRLPIIIHVFTTETLYPAKWSISKDGKQM